VSTPVGPQPFAGIDTSKLDDVVSAVWDHKDDVAGAVSFVRDHGDELLELVARLPELLASAASALTDAATDTRATATFLTGSGLTGSGEAQDGVKSLAALAGTALEACRSELADARAMLENLAGALDGVPLLGPAAKKLEDGAAHFNGVGSHLGVVAEHLRAIGGLVDQAGAGLARTADKLDSGGKALGALGAQR
jgi:hypothetical protein